MKFFTRQKLFPKVFLFIFFFSLFANGQALTAKAEISFESRNNPFIPNDVLDDFDAASLETKSSFCNGGSGIVPSVKKLSQNPPNRIFGFTSRMDNAHEVEGIAALNQFALGMSQLQTTAWAMQENAMKEVALEALYQWAQAEALLATYNCQDGSNSKCRAWRREDGQDKAPAMDYSKAQMEVMHLAYGYYSSLTSFKVDDPRHETIDVWFRKFSSRNKSPQKSKERIGFGLDYGWSWPAIVFGHKDKASPFSDKNAKKILARAVSRLDDLYLDDGSIINRTTRGDRALWYHLTALVETMITLEMARALDVPIPSTLDQKIERGFEIFINGFEDYSYMDTWAQVAHNSIYTPGVQNFFDTLNIPNGNSAFYIFTYRYPDSPVTKRLESKLAPYKRSAVKDGYVGFGFGCVYAVAKRARFGKPELPEEVTKTPADSTPGNPLDIRQVEVLMPGLFPKNSDEQEQVEMTFSNVRIDYDNAENEFEEIAFTVEGLKVANVSRKNIKFKLVFDYKSLEMKRADTPDLIRLQFNVSNLLGPFDSTAAEKCHHANIRITQGVVDRIKFAYGRDADDGNCILQALSTSDANMIYAVIQNIFDILEAIDDPRTNKADVKFTNYLS